MPSHHFDGISKSCLKQVVTKPRVTKLTSVDARISNQAAIKKKIDTIPSFHAFVQGVLKRLRGFYMVLQLLHF